MWPGIATGTNGRLFISAIDMYIADLKKQSSFFAFIPSLNNSLSSKNKEEKPILLGKNNKINMESEKDGKN